MTIYHRFEIAASRTSVFNAVSDPEHLINWWPLKCSGTPLLGSNYNFYFGEPYDWYAEVVQLKINESIHFKVNVAMSEWLPTTFGFDLIENGGSTIVEFEHKDWTEAHQEFRSASYCWAMLLNTLKAYLEKGIIVIFEERS